MGWTVEVVDEFASEFFELSKEVQDALAARVRLLEEFGPSLKRPHCDTLKVSRFSNMKELRFEADDGTWRVAFAFDPRRSAILLVAGDKSGVSEVKFYRQLIDVADRRFDAHLRGLKGE